MTFKGLILVSKAILRGEFKAVMEDAWARAYKQTFNGIFWCHLRKQRASATLPEYQLALKTDYPIAFKSPDHLVPWGTKNDNSTNRKFVLYFDQLVRSQPVRQPMGYMDLGCSGGQLVKDFKDLGWAAIGLEGSDYSLKHKRANWPMMAGKNLFTCDITKPFHVLCNGQPAKCHLTTAWEVLEHIHPNDLPAVFANIIGHMERGGYFVATTTSAPDIHDGVDLHQTKMTNQAWRDWIAEHVPELEMVDLGLKYYQYVRHEERAFLTYRRK